LIGVVVLLIFIAGVLLLERLENTKQERAVLEGRLTGIQEEVQQAEANVIYGRESQAWESLTRAEQDLVPFLAAREDDVRARAETILQVLEEQKNAIRKQQRVSLLSLEDSEAIALLKERVSPQEELRLLGIARSGVDLASYAGRLYVLSPEAGQIYKHLPAGDRYDGGTAWVISGVSSLKDAVAIAVDGSIWVLSRDGSIRRFLTGREEAWTLGTVDPPLTRTGDLWTDETTSFLYALDTEGRRVAVIEKSSGLLQVQYVVEEGVELQQMLVQEAQGRVAVLTPEGPRFFSLTHLSGSDNLGPP
jgi:hypothetical protein